MSSSQPKNALTSLLRGNAAARINGFLILFMAVFFTLMHLYAAIYGAPPTMLFRPLHLSLALVLLLLIHPLGRRWSDPFNRWSIIDGALFVGAVWLIWYYVSTSQGWALRQVIMSNVDVFAALLTLFLIAEGVRRTLGPILLIVAGSFVVHALFANYAPGILYGPPVKPLTLLRALVLGDSGIFGTPLGVMAQYVVMFILFGNLLAVVGVGNFFLRLSFSLFGHRTGGPAKAAVVSSAMMGTLSGSAIGNVLTTGAFTIPLMRQLGYRPAFAGGAEAAASTGGMIMPPVMGAIAFIMAEFLGRPYSEIILAALIPALLYFLVIFVAVHFEALRTGLRTLPKDALPRTWEVLRKQSYLLLPIGLIIGGLMAGYSIVLVAVIAVFGTILIGFVNRSTWPTPLRLAEAIEQTSRSTVALSVTAAAAGVIIGAIFSTGLSFQITQGALQIAGERLWLLLIMSGIVAIVLGMGMTASAVYITMVATVVPILRAMNVDELAAHMFAFYFGIVSNITPPVALAAFAAAPLANANPMATSVAAARLGIAAFIIPVMFVYQPALLMIGSWSVILQASVTAAFGLSALSIAFVGYFSAPIILPLRLVMIFGAGMMIIPEWRTDLGGTAIVLLTLLASRFVKARQGKSEERASGSRKSAIRMAVERLIAKRVAKAALGEGDGEASGLEGPRKLADLTRAQEAYGGIAAHTRFALWFGWAVFALLAVGMHVMGTSLIQARDPQTWVWQMAALSLFLTAGLAVTFWRSALTTLAAGERDGEPA
ncbi:TRAP transporter permease [Oceanibacterium hippocampi]|nr:TRAP transporter fused permease subunit [Oceanibacterium hippocampi]